MSFESESSSDELESSSDKSESSSDESGVSSTVESPEVSFFLDESSLVSFLVESEVSSTVKSEVPFESANTSIPYGDEMLRGIEIIDAIRINATPKLKIF